jgi:hypothetical protein
MLEPQSSAWRELEGAARAPWTSPPDAARKDGRAKEMVAATARCRAVSAPRIRGEVVAIDTKEPAGLCSVVFHSFHLLLVSADETGFIRANNGLAGSNLNTFHVTNGEAGGGRGW